jgi:hypothetical protein
VDKGDIVRFAEEFTMSPSSALRAVDRSSSITPPTAESDDVKKTDRTFSVAKAMAGKETSHQVPHNPLASARTADLRQDYETPAPLVNLLALLEPDTEMRRRKKGEEWTARCILYADMLALEPAISALGSIHSVL